MEYRIRDVCKELGIGNSSFYNILDNLKSSVPEDELEQYFFWRDKRFFVTEKGFEYFMSNKSEKKRKSETFNNSSSDIVIYQEHIINMQNERISFLESENKRLLEIISLKEKKEIANSSVNLLGNNNEIENRSFLNRFFGLFKH